MITGYRSFKENLLLESLINESYLYFSPPLEKLISKMDNNIARDLMSIRQTDIKPDITFLNIDKEGYVSFTTMKNAVKKLIKQWGHSEDSWTNVPLESGDLDNIWKLHTQNKETDVYGGSRNSLKLGKLINKLFPGKYTDKDIEEFVNQFKASVENNQERFEIVEGEDIDHWYQLKNYAKNSGTLGNSCMAQKRGIFGIYVKNPEVCKMLILREGDKILGRALIWKLNTIRHMGKDLEGVEYFMDRQYTINDSDVIKFRNYAKEQKGWVSKANNNHHSFEPIIHHQENDRIINVGMTVKLKKNGESYDYGSYPYVDTFRRYNPENGMLYNDDDSDDSSNEDQYLLQDTQGGYERIEGGVWSEYYDRMIPEDDAVYSDWLGTYIWRESATKVERGQSRYHGWYPDDYDDIVWCDDIDEPVFVDDAVYSDRDYRWLFKENAVKAVYEIDADGDVDSYDSHDEWFSDDDNDIMTIDTSLDWYQFLSDRHSNWDDYEYILKELMTEDINKDDIPKQFAIKVYKVGSAKKEDAINIAGIEYLTELDARVLGYEIDKDEEETIDQFHYHKDLEPILPKLYTLMSNQWIEINNQLEDKGQLRIKFKDFNDGEYLTELARKANELDDRLIELEDDKYFNLEDEITITRHD